jgi:hypothetical protein
MTLSKNSISLAGEFAVLSQLALRGIDANLTLGNTKGVDILASNPMTGFMFKLEVKTSYNKKPVFSKLFGNTLSWVMSDKHEHTEDPGLFYCFTNIEISANAFRFFIVPSAIVARYVRESHQFWLRQKTAGGSEHVDNRVRNFRLGLDDRGYSIETPLADEYEDKWGFCA